MLPLCCLQPGSCLEKATVVAVGNATERLKGAGGSLPVGVLVQGRASSPYFSVGVFSLGLGPALSWFQMEGDVF